jgi:hypothetical protein
MWLKRKSRNRRVRRENVLDVKLRSNQVRAVRVRAFSLWLGVVLGAVLTVLLAWKLGNWGLNRLVFENPAFTVRNLDISTDGSIPVEQLRRWTALRPTENLLALDLARIKRNLELSPHVQSVAVERMLPGTLKIRVTEREAIAQVQAPGPRVGGGYVTNIFHLDAAGFVMMPMDQAVAGPGAATMEHLPLLTGVPRTELRPGRRVDSPQVHAALRLVHAFGNSPMAGVVDLAQVDVSAPEVLRVLTGQGSEVYFGGRALDQQLRRWRILHEYGEQHQKAIKSLDLSVAENIPAVWMEASAALPATPKPAKPSRSRKKNA